MIIEGVMRLPNLLVDYRNKNTQDDERTNVMSKRQKNAAIVSTINPPKIRTHTYGLSYKVCRGYIANYCYKKYWRNIIIPSAREASAK